MTHTLKRNFLFWLTIVFLHIVIATPAFAQMQGSTTYSDSWGDGDYVYGSGVTDSPYNSYNHTFRAVTTMTSPLGRVSSYDSGYGSGAAFVSLSFDEDDLGLYTVETDHYDYCPIVFAEAFIGHSGSSVRTGRTLLCFNFYELSDSGLNCIYILQNPCENVTRCKKTVESLPKIANVSCWPKVHVKYRWVEKQDGCQCNITCTRTSFTPLQANDPCNCSELSSA